jgi:type IV secretory pathway VirB3-like protein
MRQSTMIRYGTRPLCIVGIVANLWALVFFAVTSLSAALNIVSITLCALLFWWITRILHETERNEANLAEDLRILRIRDREDDTN